MKINSFNLSDTILIKEFVKISDQNFMDNDYIPKNNLDEESLLKELSAENEFFKHAKAKFFTIKDENNIYLGRVLAFIDLLIGPDVGFIGYFICINDLDISNKLLLSAQEWLKEQKVKIIKGPINLSIYNSYRFMTDGFEQDVYLGEPRNPSYYPKLFQAFGLETDAYWRSFDLDKRQCQVLGYGINEAIKLVEDQHILIETVELNNLEEELRMLYNHALEIFRENYNYSNISENEFVAQFMTLKNVLAPGSFLIARDKKTSQCIGFVYGYLDFAQNLKNNDFVNKPRRFIFHTFGVKEAYRKTATAYLLASAIFENMQPYFDTAIGALAKEGKSFYDKVSLPTRVYTTFKKALS